MYARFTDRARKVMQLANQEAQRFNHDYVGTEHILLGLIRESGVAAHVFKNLAVDVQKVRHAVEQLIPEGPNTLTMGRLPHTPRAKAVLRFANEEADALKHKHVGTEHLLLGLLREEEGVAAQVLKDFGLSLGFVRAEIDKLVSRYQWKAQGVIDVTTPTCKMDEKDRGIIDVTEPTLKMDELGGLYMAIYVLKDEDHRFAVPAFGDFGIRGEYVYGPALILEQCGKETTSLSYFELNSARLWEWLGAMSQIGRYVAHKPELRKQLPPELFKYWEGARAAS